MQQVTFFVYLLTFANAKVYVGMSRTDAKGLYTARYRNHARDARRGKDLPVHRAWRKHGPPVQTVLSTHDTRAECAEAEIAAIREFDSTDPVKGYNLLLGGQGLHAPRGSAVHRLMQEKVWGNPEVRAKRSAALKGRPLSPNTRAGHAAWRETEQAKAFIASVARRPEVRAAASATMKERLASGFREYLSAVQLGKPKNVTPEGMARGNAKRRSWAQTAEGQAAIRRGTAALRSNPEAMAKRKANHAKYLASEANAELCRANSAKASKPVRDVRTGEVYASIRGAAAALNVTSPTIHYRLRKGLFERI